MAVWFRKSRGLEIGPRGRELILVWSADGPHAIRSQSSSAINIQQTPKGPGGQ
jgi:hypothetical protein